MRFETAQHMKLGQQMKLAPRMIQSMEILQLPMLALQERIEQELESNIALEQVEPEDDGELSPTLDGEDASEEKLDRRELVVGEPSSNGSDDFERLSAFEANYSEAIDHDYPTERYAPSRMAGERDRKMDAMANIAARGEGLADQLLHQWSFAEVDPEIAAVGERIIGYVNDDGLLGADLETILEQNRSIPGVELDIELLERAIKHLHHWLDPPGVAARDQRECLLLQVDALEANGDDDSGHEGGAAGAAWNDVRLLIEDHFDDLLQNRLPRIQQKTDLPMERIQAAIALMRKLNLSPGRDLVDVDVPPVVPDVIVDYEETTDSYVAALADGRLPVLRISPHYEQMAKDRSTDKDTREFLGNSVRSATWLIESINQRKNTLLRVVNVVLTRQREYFDHGPQHLKPLPMIEVADQLGIHVGTVSRAVADKWLQTPRGVVPLRKFFSGGTETDSGRDMSWEAVKAILSEIVGGEDRANPLSDEAIAAELKKRGIEIARRTVVKYRQQLNIPPARRRKVY
jgi:RNA polymerase sigma-54 factor